MNNPIHFRTINEILDEDYKLVIPIYQREYRWTESEICPFIEDIISDFRHKNDSPSSNRFYTIGMIYYDTSGIDGNKTKEIIDGQQRITTLFVLKKVLEDLLEEESCMINSNGEFILKAEFNRLNDEYREVFSKEGISQKRTSDSLLGRCYKSIHNLLKHEEDMNIHNRNALENKIEFDKNIRNTQYKDLLAFILDEIKIICYSTSASSEAQELFLKLNTRGIELSFVDMIKSYLYKFDSGEKKDAKKFINFIWEHLSNMNGNEYKTIESGFRSFIKAYTGNKEPKLAKNAYRQLIEIVNSNGISKFVNESTSFVSKYIEFQSSKVSKKTKFNSHKSIYAGLKKVKNEDFCPLVIRYSIADEDVKFSKKLLDLTIFKKVEHEKVQHTNKISSSIISKEIFDHKKELNYKKVWDSIYGQMGSARKYVKHMERAIPNDWRELLKQNLMYIKNNQDDFPASIQSVIEVAEKCM